MKTKKVSIKDLGRSLQTSDRVYLKNLTPQFLLENNPTGLGKPLLFQMTTASPILAGKSLRITEIAVDGDFKAEVVALDPQDLVTTLLESMSLGWINPAWVSEVEILADQVWTLSDVFEIHEVACGGWKSRLQKHFFGNRNWYKGYVDLPVDFIRAMRGSASDTQSRVLERVLERLSDEVTVEQTFPETTVTVKFREIYKIDDRLTLIPLQYSQALARENNHGGLSSESYLRYRLCQTLFKDMVWKVKRVFGDGDLRIEPASETDKALVEAETDCSDPVVSPAWTKPCNVGGDCVLESIVIPWPVMFEWGQKDSTVRERMTTLQFEMTPAGAVFNSTQWEHLSENVTVPQEITSVLNSNGN